MQNIEPSRHCRRCCCGISLPSFERIVANFSQQRQNIIPIIDFCVQYVFGAAKARQPGGSITKGFLVPGVIPGRISSRKSSLRLDFFLCTSFLPQKLVLFAPPLARSIRIICVVMKCKINCILWRNEEFHAVRESFPSRSVQIFPRH